MLAGMNDTPSIDPTALRVFIYDYLLARGVPPSNEQIGQRFGVAPDDARRAIKSLNIGKTVLPHPATGEIWMAGPFAAQPTSYRVIGRGASWWANCAWDMLGIAVIAGEPVRVEATCTDCGEPVALDVNPDGGVASRDLVVHFLVPARRWYEDIGYT